MGNIDDASNAIFTPCSYKISSVEVLEGTTTLISEIVSFRGRFCEQASEGDTVIAQGKVETVFEKGRESHSRLLIGNQVTDFMVSKIL
jgi:predicted nucleotidyltransferase